MLLPLRYLVSGIVTGWGRTFQLPYRKRGISRSKVKKREGERERDGGFLGIAQEAYYSLVQFRIDRERMVLYR
ncbi:hypothetical protein L873DRAFT_1800311 [Choiromyces venosus 120613-1]|uniref:Uncharacterized protein n=1 Tax=Choiromyces venosus 120613-1 TaxID=1336337 RepID=A0A3N4K359_9PEZI|nr:hypothetical protein L873DRAFT_1800311 [Choiromyces venosus 120613-1]